MPLTRVRPSNRPKSVMNLARTLSTNPKCVSSSEQTLETSDRCSSFLNPSSLAGAIVEKDTEIAREIH